MGGIAHTLDGVATLTAALESSEIEILDIEVRTSGQTAAGDGSVVVSLRLPDGTRESDHVDGEGESNVFYLQIRPEDAEATTAVVPQSGSIPQEVSGSSEAGESEHAEVGVDDSPAAAGEDGTADTAGRGEAGTDRDTTRTDSKATGSEPGHEVSDAGETASTDEDSGSQVPCRHDDCEETFETERGMKIHFTKTHLEGAGTDDESEDDRPAYADPAKLRRVYEKHDTFEEMTEALDVEVTPATVRRHMIKYGIYDPSADAGDDEPPSERSVSSARDRRSPDDRPDSRRRTSEAGEESADTDEPGTDSDDADPVESIRELLARRDDSRVPLPDDDELPDGITVPDVIDAVVASQTVYQVATHLETNRETAREVLEQADLLDLVERRLDAETTREERERKVAARIEAMTRPQVSPQP